MMLVESLSPSEPLVEKYYHYLPTPMKSFS
jgi:hypothetical protein